jgi:CRISPR system Cascade subunit CasD
MDVLLLRLEAPLMSFGGPAVDQNGVTRDFPARSMLAGLCANALGYKHRDAAWLQALQNRLRFGVRRDRAGERLVDYQTVDLGLPSMSGTGWTTRGAPQERAGASSEGTHIRLRHYIADAAYTIALTLLGDGEPALGALEHALREPARPLFLGRKACIPSAPLVLSRVETATLAEALRAAPVPARRSREAPATELLAWLPHDDTPEAELPGAGSRLLPVSDERDWSNQIHVGRRLVRECLLRLRPAETP